MDIFKSQVIQLLNESILGRGVETESDDIRAKSQCMVYCAMVLNSQARIKVLGGRSHGLAELNPSDTA